MGGAAAAVLRTGWLRGLGPSTDGDSRATQMMLGAIRD